jgi:hypothetical protein
MSATIGVIAYALTVLASPDEHALTAKPVRSTYSGCPGRRGCDVEGDRQETRHLDAGGVAVQRRSPG